MKKIDDNAYVLDFLGQYGVCATFSVANLSLFDHADSRMNDTKERGC